MKRVRKIISLCLQYRKYMSILDPQLFWKVKVGFNLQIKNVFGSLKKYKL